MGIALIIIGILVTAFGGLAVAGTISGGGLGLVCSLLIMLVGAVLLTGGLLHDALASLLHEIRRHRPK